MLFDKTRFIAFAFLALTFASVAVPTARAKTGNEYDAVCDFIEERYQAKKEKIPFMWLARLAVGIVRPAGVKSFKVTIYRDLKFSPATLNDEMRVLMKGAFTDAWSPILRVRSRNGGQVYMNMRRSGKKNVKILLVTIDSNEAVIIRAKFNPDKLAEFISNPKIFGISLDSRKKGDPVDSGDVRKDVKKSLERQKAKAAERCQEPSGC